MKFLTVILTLAFAAPAAGAEPAAPQSQDSIQELAGALMRSGAISQPDWWKIVQLRGSELNAAPAQYRSQPPAVPTPPTPPPPAAQISAAPKPAPMKIGGLAWFRYTYADAAANATNTTAFGLKVARLSFSGELPENFKYAVTLAFERLPSTSTQNNAMYDWTLSWTPRPEIGLTAGQFTVPASAELLTPTSQIDFAARYYAQDRILNPSFNHDQGLMASGKVLGQKLQYMAGLFNGKGANYSDNDNDKFLYSGRLCWSAWKGKFGGRDSSVTAGVSGMAESTRGDQSALKTSDLTGAVFTRAYGRYVYGGDLLLKSGPATLKGEYIAARLDGRRADPDFYAEGWYATAAYRLPGDKLELLARVQGYDPDTSRRTAKDIRWTTYGVNWFINGYTTRALLNYTVKRERKAAVPNNEVIAQLQLAF